MISLLQILQENTYCITPFSVGVIDISDSPNFVAKSQ